MRVAIIVNPIAGMGGSVGLKGTDGERILEEALKRGAEPVAGQRMAEALASAGDLEGVELITCGGPMGADVLASLHLDCKVEYEPEKATKAQDTVAAARRMVEAEAGIVVFAGGDGTARDIMDAIDRAVPAIGVPSGVKMHSAVFANSPRDAGELLAYCIDGSVDFEEAEVMDIDEDAFRQGRLSARLYGYLLVPREPSLMQPVKGEVVGRAADEEKEEVAEFFAESAEKGVVYLLGPGTTLAAIAERLGVPKTLLGVDAVVDGRLIGSDLGEDAILDLLDKHGDARIVVTPIGSQGFILGRGNQQISPKVIRRVGKGNIIVVSSATKLATIEALRVDTGDVELDEELKGYRRVLVGRGRWRMIRVL